MRGLFTALAVTAIACASAPPKPDAEPASSPTPAARPEPAVAPEPVAKVEPAPTPEPVAVSPAPAKDVESPAATKDAGATVAQAPAAARDAGTPVAKKEEVPAAAPKPSGARDGGTIAAKTAVAKDPVKDAGVEAAKPVAVALGPVAAPDKKTERLWKSKCSACHGADGKAATEKGRKMKMSDLTSAAWQKSRTDEQIKKAILEGRDLKKDGVEQVMDPYAEELQPDQVKALVGFVRWVGAPR